jgi:hypothetical protein
VVTWRNFLRKRLGQVVPVLVSSTKYATSSAVGAKRVPACQRACSRKNKGRFNSRRSAAVGLVVSACAAFKCVMTSSVSSAATTSESHGSASSAAATARSYRQASHPIYGKGLYNTRATPYNFFFLKCSERGGEGSHVGTGCMEGDGSRGERGERGGGALPVLSQHAPAVLCRRTRLRLHRIACPRFIARPR